MLQGKTAIITGSSQSIGLAIATRFAQSGINILMNGIESRDQVEQQRNEIETAYGVDVLYRQADMTSPSEIRDLVAFGQSRFGNIDILVNNAGIQYVAPVDELPEDKWDAIVAINMSSVFHAIKAALPRMRQCGWGRIINIASVHGLVASPLKSAYVAAKHGVVGLTKSVALEVADSGITANAICPGYVWTPLVERQIPDIAETRGISEQAVVDDVILSVMPTRRFVTMEEVAELALFLCKDEAHSMTGSAISIDGGWGAQ